MYQVSIDGKPALENNDPDSNYLLTLDDAKAYAFRHAHDFKIGISTAKRIISSKRFTTEIQNHRPITSIMLNNRLIEIQFVTRH